RISPGSARPLARYAGRAAPAVDVPDRISARDVRNVGALAHAQSRWPDVVAPPGYRGCVCRSRAACGLVRRRAAVATRRPALTLPGNAGRYPRLSLCATGRSRRPKGRSRAAAPDSWIQAAEPIRRRRHAMVARAVVTGVAALALAGASMVDAAWARGHGG